MISYPLPMRPSADRLRCLFLGIFVLYASLARAELSLGTPFSDRAVLQRDKPVPVWGTAKPGAGVKVVFGGQEISATSDAKGRWTATLSPMSASAEGAELKVTSGTETKTIRDVLVGEVWICTGQSNMAFKVKDVVNAEAEMAAAEYPQIRQLLVAPKIADEPQDKAAAQWKPALPQNMGDFSGTAYFFGRKLYQELGVPIGLINASLGGTGVEAWMSAEALTADANYPAVKSRWEEALKTFPARFEEFQKKRTEWLEARDQAQKEGRKFTQKPPRRPPGPGDKNQLSGLFNGMVHPLIPYAARGFIWYQGEHNAFRNTEYASLFQSLIKQWRRDFQQEDQPFYFVQLPNLNHKLDPTKAAWAYQRAAQASALSLPLTGMAITIDIGDPNDIHPRNKQDVGARLALLALARTYGKGGVASGPLFAGATVEGSSLRVSFQEAEGLQLKGSPDTAFELAGADGVFHPATPQIEGAAVLLSSPAVPHPEAARYAWTNNPSAVLFNGAGLPAAPFQTKDIPPPTLNETAGGED